MIIGINGYIGSGKDTVGKIIQEEVIRKNATYQDERTSEYINRLAAEGREFRSGWEIKKFAAKLKQMASLLTGIPAEKFEDQEFKKTELGPEWQQIHHNWIHPEEVKKRAEYSAMTVQDFIAYYKLQKSNNGPNGQFAYFDSSWSSPMTVRDLLQRLGTEAIRNQLHPNAWVNALFADYKEAPVNVLVGEGYHLEDRFPNWLITDTRFQNEAQAIKDRGGIVIRVSRLPEKIFIANSDKEVEHIPFDKNNVTHMDIYRGDILRKHSSETSLDDWPFDYTVDNNGTLEQLVQRVQAMNEQFKLW